MRGLCFFYIIISNTSMEMLAGIPRQTQARTVYQFTARLTPVSSPSEFTASRAAKAVLSFKFFHSVNQGLDYQRIGRFVKTCICTLK